MRQGLTRAAAAAAALVLLAGCGGEETPPASTDEPSTSSTPSESSDTPSAEPSESEEPEEPEEPEGTTVEVTVEGDTITPNGERLEVEVGETVTLQVTSDRAGELHVHSTPDQTPTFEAGTTDIEITIERPGVVEVEEHESGFVIALLQVS